MTSTTLRSSPSGEEFALVAPLAAYGLQTAWAIDPALGDDAGPGTPAHPLRTMAEFNARMASQLVQVPQTLQLVGDVVDQPLWLAGTRYLSGASLLVSGTTTLLADRIAISAVVSLNGALFPWQLTTSGIDWTTVNLLQTQVRFATGEVAGIAAVVDANNVILGAPVALGSFSPITPTTAMTLSVLSLSRALPPMFSCMGVTASVFTAQVTLRDLQFNPAQQNLIQCEGGALVNLYGCNFNATGAMTLQLSSSLSLLACRLNLNGNGCTWRTNNAANGAATSSLVVVGNGTTAAFINHQTGTTSHINLMLQGARLLVSGGTCSVLVGSTNIRGAAGPILVQSGGLLTMNSAVTGSTGNTGIGIDVPNGTVGYFSSGKPTVTGASDCRVNGIAKTYAQIPFTSLDATVPTNLTGNGAKIIQVN
jgi:hypothetical protein